MTSAARTRSNFKSRKHGHYGELRARELPICRKTALPIHDERHQANDAAKAIRHGDDPDAIVTVVRCEAGRHYHLEVGDRYLVQSNAEVPEMADSDEPRRLILLDSENATHGAHGVDETPLAEFMAVLTGEAITITAADKIIAFAARTVARKLHAAVSGPNVEWIVGRDEKDGADRAALNWARLHLQSVAQDYDELVIVSGDHCFERVARRWLKYNPSKRVHVVTTETPDGHASLSSALSAVAHRRTLIRRTSRRTQVQNKIASDIVARTHRRVHIDNPALVAA